MPLDNNAPAPLIDPIDQQLAAARALAKEVAAADDDSSTALAKAGNAAIASLATFSTAATAARADFHNRVRAASSITGRVGDDAARAVSKVGPAGMNYHQQQQDARARVAGSAAAAIGNQVLADRGDTLTEKANAASAACVAFETAIAREDALATGIGAALSGNRTIEQIMNDAELERECEPKSSNELVALYKLIRDGGDEDQLARLQRVALKLANRRLAAKSAARQSDAELSERAAASILVAAIMNDRTASSGASIEIAKKLALAMRGLFKMSGLGFDAMRASTKEMDDLRNDAAKFSTITAPYSVSPGFAARLLA